MRRLPTIDKSAYARGAADADLDGECCRRAVSHWEMSMARYAAIDEDLAKFRDQRVDAVDVLSSVLHFNSIRL